MPLEFDFENLFSYHAPKGNQAQRYETLRSQAKLFATTIQQCCPDSADRTDAIRKVREAVMMANASIAVNE